jgi:hypothetical protein
MSEINALIEKLKAATGPDRELDAAVFKACGHRVEYNGTREFTPYLVTTDQREWRIAGGYTLLPNATASIDIALSLVDKMLPGWVWGITAPVGRMADGMLWKPDTDDERGFSRKVKVEAPTPPLAILLSLLLALSQEKTK